ncbi:MAG: ABC transporter ATP-binding protein [Clostridia bacterium]|nr:ABC transporter ATP-binding protein [Clostridia bacterium]
MLSVKNLTKTYQTGKSGQNTVVALNNVSIDFPETGFVFLLGKSGSGKSTLLNVIGGLDVYDKGEIVIKGKSSKTFTQSDFDSYRNTFIGFIFQEYNILENFTVAKNLALAIELQGKKANKEEVNKLLNQVEMLPYATRKPNQLSGGQKQRVAIARALIKNPEIIMADEPTGALDSNTGKQVMDTLKELSKTKLVIVVSHDRDFAEIYGDRIIELKDGVIISDVTKKEVESKQTESGVKIIDDSILYIKKGQKITDAQLKQISDFVVQKSQQSDTFISFSEDANEKLKESANINEEGNREKFVETEKDDINLKQYNPNSLKLIKSRLKFTDSFKIGTSSLKHKVGRLIFTILLSFFAFTVFGVVDALSCWNRSASVYQALELTHQKYVALSKRIKTDNGYRGGSVKQKDIEKLKEKFPNYTFKGVADGPS